MKLTPTSEVLLKNFASINPNFYAVPGNHISTKSPTSELVVHCDLDIEFPVEFGIFDMNKFLSSVALVDDPELDFEERSVRIFNQSTSLKYNYADKEALNTFDRVPTMGDVKVAFVLKQSQLDSLKKAASTLAHDDIAFVNVDGKLTAVVDTVNSMNKNVQRNTFELNLDVPVQGDFRYVVKLSQLVMIPGDYSVEFSSERRAHYGKFFRTDATNLTYYMGLNFKESYYNG